MNDFIEQQITGGVKRLLTGRVNELLGDIELQMPLIEFSGYSGGTAVVPVISLCSCERTEKERIILLDAYTLTVTFSVPETEDGELFCYAYAAAVCKALGENPTLGGVADRAAVTGKKYSKPKMAYGGNEWQVILTLRITTEGNINVS